MAMGEKKVEIKSRHLVHMTSEDDLEVDMEVLPAEPRRSCGELLYVTAQSSCHHTDLGIDTQRESAHLVCHTYTH